MCDVIYIVASWLREEDRIPATAALPKKKWKQKLRQEWQQITGHTVQVRRPRHTLEEAAKLFAALPAADPRLRLLLELAAELRLGQAVRAKRTDLQLGEEGGFRLGRFVVHGNGKKKGEVVDLHPELRATVDKALNHGYLADAEAAYQRGEVEDYLLFPAGRLKEGRALLARCLDQPLGPKSVRSFFAKLEDAAGVTHQPGRACYGLRRQATDLAPEYEQNARVLNRLTGHVRSETREQVYQDRASDAIRARAAVARQSMRRRLYEVAVAG